MYSSSVKSASATSFVPVICSTWTTSPKESRRPNPVLPVRPLPLVWSRSYYSDQDGIGWLGEDWSMSGCQRIYPWCGGIGLYRRSGPFVPAAGSRWRWCGTGIVRERTDLVQQRARTGASLISSIVLRFAPLVVAEDGSDEDSTLFPLVAVEDANGNHQRFVYHAGRSAAICHRR